MLREDGREDLLSQLLLQWLRKHVQELHVGLLDFHPLCSGSVFSILQNANCQLTRDVLSFQEAPQCGEVLIQHAAELAKMRHCRSDTAHEAREEDHGEYQDSHCKDALMNIQGYHLHGCRSKLGKRPMHGREVFISEGGPYVFPRPSVCVFICAHTDAPPQAPNEVVYAHKHENLFKNAQNDMEVFRGNSVLDFLLQLLQLHQPQQP
mmetsp:Transcript_69625/g.148939  ORF Transcript_69625/g.148939 Transcript_69625/m.148939 type:complete len:207 (+) Transcript_69625:723-1343(+)